MKPIQFLIFCVACLTQTAIGQITDPNQEYRRLIAENKTKGLLEANTDETMYKWNADVNGDGKVIVFLTLKDFYQKDRHDGQIPQWTVYIPKADGSGYLSAPNNEPQIDQEKMFVGQITQLNQRGIVTIQIDRPRRDPAVAYIYAYTIEGDHLKQTKLAEYDPDAGDNIICNQYLTDTKRTRVVLQEIGP